MERYHEGRKVQPEGFEHFFKEFRTVFPDLHLTYDQVVADEDRIAVAYTLTNIYNGVYLGFPPTGKQMKVRGVQIAKIANGQLVERWGSSDQLGMLQQLGLAPPPTQGRHFEDPVGVLETVLLPDERRSCSMFPCFPGLPAVSSKNRCIKSKRSSPIPLSDGGFFFVFLA